MLFKQWYYALFLMLVTSFRHCWRGFDVLHGFAKADACGFVAFVEFFGIGLVH
jgi:hypothetical protein